MKKTSSLPTTHKIGEYTACCGQRHIFPYTIECGIYQPQKEIYRLRIRILSIQTVNLSVGSVGPIADYSHSIVDGGFDEMS